MTYAIVGFGAIGTTVVAKSLREALEADTVFLAVPFGELAKLDKGGALVHAHGRAWGPLIVQDLFKKDPQPLVDDQSNESTPRRMVAVLASC